MAKEKKLGFLAAKKILDKNQYEVYKEQKIALRKKQLLDQIQATRAPAKAATRLMAYDKTRTGAVSRGIGNFFNFAQKGAARSLHERAYAPTGQRISGITTGKRGRPVASYDKRYAAYGGVYGYRKLLNARLREQRMQNLRNLAINPQQQAVLAQIEARQQAQRLDPEGRPIPNTYGNVPMKNIMDEIDQAANIFP